MLSFKRQSLPLLKNLNTLNNVHVGSKVPQWIKDCIDDDINNPVLSNLNNESAIVRDALDKYYQTQKHIKIGWVILNNLDGAEQVRRLKEIIPDETIVYCLQEYQLHRKYKKGIYFSEMAEILKLRFEDEISNSFINHRG